MKRDGQRVTMSLPMLARLAAVQPATIDADRRTVELVWSTGAAVRRYDWMRGRYYDEELSLDKAHCDLSRLNSGAPLLDTHGQWQLDDVIGVVEKAWIKDGEGRAVVRFSDREEVQPVFRDVQAGIIRNVSVGYQVRKFEVTEEQGKLLRYRATDWCPMEVSLVPVGADAGAGVRDGKQDQASYPCEVITRATAQTEESSMKKDAPAEKPAETGNTDAPATGSDATRAPSPAPAQPDAAAIAAETRQQSAEVLRRCRAVGLADSFAEDLIERGILGDAAAAAITDEIAKRNPARPALPRVEPGADEKDRFLRGAADWLLVRANVGHIVADAAKIRPELAPGKIDPGEFRGYSLVEIARMCLDRAGVNTRGMDKMKLVGMALTYRGSFTQSTSDFANLLENTMHKVLQAAYVITPDTWSRFCGRSTVSDFRAHSRYRLGNFGSLDSLNELGEFKNKAIPDAEKASITASTKGNLINLSRQAIINDDMGAFNRLATMLGRAAKLSVEKDVYALLAQNSGAGPTMSDGNALFHTAHSNIVTSSPGTPSVTEADKMRVILGSQKDPGAGEEYLALLPAVWLMGLGYGAAGRVVNEAQYDPDTANKLQRPNTSRGIVRDVVDTPRISGTKHYMFADPNQTPCLEVAFLDGQMDPFMDYEEGFSVDGVRWKVRLDYGVAAVDYRPAVYDPGQ